MNWGGSRTLQNIGLELLKNSTINPMTETRAGNWGKAVGTGLETSINRERNLAMMQAVMGGTPTGLSGMPPQNVGGNEAPVSPEEGTPEAQPVTGMGADWLTPQQKSILSYVGMTDPEKMMQMFVAMKQNYISASTSASNTLFTQESGLRGEFTDLNKDFRTIQDAYGRVLASSVKGAQGQHAAGDLAMIFNYMKMLDPGSVVREGEFASAARAAGLGERFIAAIAKVETGALLSENMRKDFLDRARKLYDQSAGGYEKVADRYTTLAKSYSGLDSSRVVPAGGVRYADSDFDKAVKGMGAGLSSTEMYTDDKTGRIVVQKDGKFFYKDDGTPFK